MTTDSNRSEPCEENCSLVNFDLALGREQGRYWQRSLDLERFASASVATLITIAVALPVFKCADKKTHIGDSSPNTFVEATVFSERSNVPRFVISISPLGFDLFAAPFTILRAVSFSSDPFPSRSRVSSGPMERAVFYPRCYTFIHARASTIYIRSSLFSSKMSKISEISLPKEKEDRYIYI